MGSSIAFNRLPIDVRVPGAYVEVDNTGASQGLNTIPTKVLVMGQQLAAGIAAPLVAQRITYTEQAVELYGPGSMLAQMIAALRQADDFVETWAIGILDDAGGTACVKTVTFGGALTGAGSLNLYVAGQRVRVAVAATSSPAAVATAIAAAITADANLPVTAAVNGVTAEQVDVTAKHKGLAGSDIDLRVNAYDGETLPPGLTVAFAVDTPGAGNPDIADIIAALGDEWYTDWVTPWTDAANLTALETELSDRFGPLKMIDGHAYAGAAGSHATLTTLGNGRNSPHLTIIGAQSSPTPPWQWAAALAATCAFFGKQDPARPFQTLPLQGILAPKVEDRFTFAERDLALRDGIATFVVDSGGVVRIERVITTYQESAGGAPDVSYLDLNTLKTLTYLRWDLRTWVQLTYPRHKLADDGTRVAVGQAVVTPKIVKGAIVSRFRRWEEQGLVENVDQFKSDLIVVRNPDDPNRLDALVPPDLINQLRVFAGLLQFKL